MKRMKELAVLAVVLLSASMFTGCSMYTYSTPGAYTNSYTNPTWAPPYYPGVRYYYLPDIESYYDLSTSEFIYLYDGVWRYSRTIPSYYSTFDLEDCFTVVLNINVYRPWLHHQYYVSHYPRYYYRDYYDHSNIPYVRGFNENRKSAIYWGENERNRARQWDNRNQEYDRRFKYQKEDRQTQKSYNSEDNVKRSTGQNTRSSRNAGNTTVNNRQNSNVNAVRSTESVRSNETTTRSTRNDNTGSDNTRTSPTNNTAGSEVSTRQQSGTSTETARTQTTNYYGKTIGNPVKVQRQMLDNSSTKNRSERNSSKTTGRR